jgi:hypothetical protein
MHAVSDPSTLNDVAAASERRSGPDRRRRVLRALLVGSFNPRRRRPRRDDERHIAALDWHHPQWLAVSMLIVLLSVADALLTLTLINLGATEANPFMAPLVGGAGYSFAFWKFGLTAGGVTLLTVLARMRMFGRVPVALVLYALLALYVALIGYEFWMLDRLSFGLLSLR